ncbi:baseplate assembly protein [Eikenella sp. NML080894]|uniref:baseplate assembly protein n=1 Tax=Eikenella sp. NML080894 TaxID=1795830 RepID=UPI0007E24FBF|nr:baseplate J/gp47 family protein [Eikenella sp. NML080894]OAM37066.1 baseplate assembly protein [Eikenella sp. NML080894]
MDLSKLKREEVKIVDDDLAQTLAATIADYEQRAGKVLQPAHIERLLINTFAYREHLLRQQVNEAYRQQHPRFATGLMLDLCGDDVSTPRLQAQPALTTLRFTAVLSGLEQIAVPKGTRVNAGQTSFVTTEAALLTAAQSSAEVAAECTESGSVGNGWSVGQINSLAERLHPTIDVAVSNTTVSAGGVEIEGDEAYRERVLLAPESFSVAGPVGAYQYWARQASPAVMDVHVANDTDGGGQPIGGRVAVTVLAKDGLPNAELIGKIQAALSAEKRRPLCDTVVVKAPTAVDYTLDAELTLFTGTDARTAKAAAEQAWAAYEAARRSRLGLDIVPLDIQTALKVAGVYNVVLHNLPLTVVKPDQWARCTSTTIRIAAQTAEG